MVRANRLRLLVAAFVLGLAVMVAFASRANAAGGKICPPDASPSCFGVTLSPNFVNVAGGNGVAVATFTNLAHSSATHTVISLTLPAGTSPVSITSNPSVNCALATLSCDFGKVGGGNTVQVFVRFAVTSPVSTLVVDGSLTFAEGNDNTGTPTNDTIHASSNTIKVSQSPSIVGTCSDGGESLERQRVDEWSVDHRRLSGGGFVARASVYSRERGDLGHRAVGLHAESRRSRTCRSLSGPGVATAFVNFPTLPPGFTYLTVQLFEIPAVGTPFLVQNCVGGAIPSGQDSCIQSRAPFGVGGVSFTLLVLGTGVDPSWALLERRARLRYQEPCASRYLVDETHSDRVLLGGVELCRLREVQDRVDPVAEPAPGRPRGRRAHRRPTSALAFVVAE